MQVLAQRQQISTSQQLPTVPESNEANTSVEPVSTQSPASATTYVYRPAPTTVPYSTYHNTAGQPTTQTYTVSQYSSLAFALTPGRQETDYYPPSLHTSGQAQIIPIACISNVGLILFCLSDINWAFSVPSGVSRFLAVGAETLVRRGDLTILRSVVACTGSTCVNQLCAVSGKVRPFEGLALHAADWLWKELAGWAMWSQYNQSIPYNPVCITWPKQFHRHVHSALFRISSFDGFDPVGGLD